MTPAAAVEDMAFVRRAGPRLLVSQPNAVQFGHLGMEMVMALARAREEQAAIAFLRAPRVVNDGAFELESDQVDVRKLSPPAESWWRSRWMLDRLLAGLEERGREFREDFWHEVGELAREETWDPAMSPRLRRMLRSTKSYAGRQRPERMAAGDPYLKRRLIRTPVPVRLRPPAAERASALAAAIGVPPGAPIVAVHAREAGWKRGREVQDKEYRGERQRDDSTRNVRIETYFAAIDCLVSRGFTVVRLGDASMKPVRRPGVVDLALDPRRTPLLDVYVLLRSAFLLAGESGPSVFTLLTNTPTLTVNATDPISSFPIRRDWLFMLKRVIDLKTGDTLTLSDMLGERYLEALRDTYRFRYVANTSQEIRDAVEEMLEFLESPPPESAGQSQFRDDVTRQSVDLGTRHKYIRKWAADRGFLGDGRVAQCYLDRTP